METSKAAKAKLYRQKKLLEKWRARLQSGTLEKSLIIQLCSLVRGGVDTSLNQDQIDSLVEQLDEGVPLKLEDSHTEQGLKFFLTKAGKCRDNAVMGQLGKFERDIVENFSHFRLASILVEYHGNLYRGATPVYEVHSKDGKSFKYAYKHMQHEKMPLVYLV